MTTRKTVLTALWAMVVLLSTNQAQALDAAGLYRERTCIACHGVEGRAPVMEGYPILAGQNAQYMLAQMKDIKNGTRVGSHSAAMKNVMHLISEDEMAVVTEWLASLPQ